MSCEGCIDKNANEEQQRIQKEASILAAQTGEWIAIYKEPDGKLQYIIATEATNVPIVGFISPPVPDAPTD